MHRNVHKIRIATICIIALSSFLSCGNNSNQSASISCKDTWLNGGAANIPKSEYSESRYVRCGDTSINLYKDSIGLCMISVDVYHADPGPYDSFLGVPNDTAFFSNSIIEQAFYKTNNIKYMKIDGGTSKGSKRQAKLNSYCRGL